ARALFLYPIRPILDLTLGLVLGDAVALLDTTHELVLLAVYGRNVIVRQFTPMLFHFAGELLPVAFNAIPVHPDFLSSWMVSARKQRGYAKAVAARPENSAADWVWLDLLASTNPKQQRLPVSVPAAWSRR